MDMLNQLNAIMVQADMVKILNDQRVWVRESGGLPPTVTTSNALHKSMKNRVKKAKELVFTTE